MAHGAAGRGSQSACRHGARRSGGSIQHEDRHAHGVYRGEPEAIREYVAECCKRGVERIVLIQSDETLFDTYARCPEFVIPVAQVDIDTIKPDEISRLIGRAPKGSSSSAPCTPTGPTSIPDGNRRGLGRQAVFRLDASYFTPALTNSRITSPSMSASLTAWACPPTCAPRSIAATSCNCLASRHDLELNAAAGAAALGGGARGGRGAAAEAVTAMLWAQRAGLCRKDVQCLALLRAAACGRLVHRDDVFHGRVDLNVGVRGSQDVAAIAAEDVDQPFHLVGDALRRPAAEHPLKIDSPIETEVLAEVSLQARGFHPRARVWTGSNMSTPESMIIGSSARTDPQTCSRNLLPCRWAFATACRR